MGKWIIPRHQPRRFSEDMRRDRNIAKKILAANQMKRTKQLKERADRIRILDERARAGDEEATREIGQCIRKEPLSRGRAISCAKAANLETGKDIWVYHCEFCNNYHLTSHPFHGARYIWSTRRKDEI